MSVKIDMQHLPGNKRTAKWQLVWLPLPLLLYIGYAAGLTWELYDAENSIMDQILYMILHPLPISTSSQVLMCLVGAFAVWIFVTSYYTASIHNRMPGKEYGSARFAKPEEINSKYQNKNDTDNRIYGKKLRISIDDRATGRNNNVLVLGGPGAGKSFFFVRPNLLQGNSSVVVTDIKGDLYRDTAPMLRRKGYIVKRLNLVNPQESDRYNPFAYLRTSTDVIRLVTNLIANTTPKNAAESDPFWSKAEGMLLQALFFYVWLVPSYAGKRNFRSVLELLREAEIPENDKAKSPLDKRMEELSKEPWHYPGQETEFPGTEHPAYLAYQAMRKGAVDTVRSIVISANARLAFLQNSPAVLDLLSEDEMDIPCIGMGYEGHLRKTALFCIIPDADVTYNSIVGMLQTQILQELYYQADHNTAMGRLPISVTLWQDEFANVAQIDRYCELLSTMRGRGISAVVIIQNLSQIKALYKDTWETIPGDADTLVYLGGNEQSTHKYIAEQLGKWTCEKRSTSESKGKSGSVSRSDDVIAKDLISQDEVRMLDNNLEIILIRGEYPVLDRKYQTHKSTLYKEAMRAKKEAEKMGDPVITDVRMFGPMAADEEAFYKKLGDPIRFSLEEFFDIDDEILEEEQQGIDAEAVVKTLRSTLRKEWAEDIRNQRQIKKAETIETIKDAIMTADYTQAQIDEAMAGFRNGLGEEDILSYFRPEFSPARMRALRETLEKRRGVGCGRFFTDADAG